MRPRGPVVPALATSRSIAPSCRSTSATIASASPGDETSATTASPPISLRDLLDLLSGTRCDSDLHPRRGQLACDPGADPPAAARDQRDALELSQ